MKKLRSMGAPISQRKNNFIILSFSLVLTVGTDQWTKALARTSLRGSERISFLGDLFRLEYAENSGAFLSLGAEWSPVFRYWIFIVLVGVFLTYLGYILFFQSSSRYQVGSYLLILGGGLGNLIDRVISGKVTDFLNLGLGSVRTGIFNLADIYVMAGIFLLIGAPFILPRSERRPSP